MDEREEKIRTSSSNHTSMRNRARRPHVESCRCSGCEETYLLKLLDAERERLSELEAHVARLRAALAFRAAVTFAEANMGEEMKPGNPNV